MSKKEEAYTKLTKILESMGYPEEFSHAIADGLGTEKTMNRMSSYLLRAHPDTPEEIADEMLAIVEERETWINKKKAEYYNRKRNEMLYWEPEEDE